MSKFIKSIKKQFKTVTDHPVISGSVALVLVLLVGGLGVLVFVVGDDEGNGGSSAKEGDKDVPKIDDDDPGVKAAKKRKVKPAPVVSGPGTLDVARSVGRLALAQGRGRIKNPSNIQVRVSAAPKQTVTVDWMLSCYKTTGTKVDSGRYRTRPPDIRSLPLPLSGAAECTASVGAQLTRGRGRVKVAVISG